MLPYFEAPWGLHMPVEMLVSFYKADGFVKSDLYRSRGIFAEK